uniref:Uncharacterized protein n=1 Tax=Castor canadensis TaxID=51338 RepID=A0A8C0XU28_CASCN
MVAGDQHREQKVAVAVIGSQQGCDSVMPTVTGILRAAKVKSAKGTKDQGHSLSASNTEFSKLLAQFPLKSTPTSKAPDNKTVLEESRVIKNFLKSSMLSGSGPQEAAGLGPFLLLPPPPSPASLDKATELSAHKRQLPVFAKICSKTEVDTTVEGHHSVEWNSGIKEPIKCRESLFLSQWPPSRKDSSGEEGRSDPVGTMATVLPTKKPTWQAEKNVLCEFLGATKNSSKVEVDGLELKFNPPATTADKNNLKYTGNVFTPRFPLWLHLNCPPVPVFTSHSTYQYQGLYPQLWARMPYQQAVHPQLGCYSRPVRRHLPPLSQHKGLGQRAIAPCPYLAGHQLYFLVTVGSRVQTRIPVWVLKHKPMSIGDDNSCHLVELLACQSLL